MNIIEHKLMILKTMNVDKTFVRTCERSNTFANADERSQKINVNVQNSTFIFFIFMINMFYCTYFLCLLLNK